MSTTPQAEGDGGRTVLQTFRGYGSARQGVAAGRLFRQARMGLRSRPGSRLALLAGLVRWLSRRGVAGASLVARYEGVEKHVSTDRDGYFQVSIEHAADPARSGEWRSMEIEMPTPHGAVAPSTLRATAQIFVPPASARFVVISDIDDTVMLTGVANRLLMLWRLFVQSADSRVAFPGVGAFYAALHRGASDDQQNPMLYVSRAPWSLYPVLEAFFNRHDIPVGPVLFLREWGLTLADPLPRRGKGHKLSLIREMLSLYDDLPFVLIGDSGQRDPEIYTQVLQENPGRVLAIFIRNISADATRTQAIEALAKTVVAAGGSLLLAADSFAMAEHAVERGLVSPEGLASVLRERIGEMGDPDLKATAVISQPTRAGTAQAVDAGALGEALQKTSDTSPANVVVEPKAEPARRA